MNRISIIDKYIIKQLIESFLLGVIVFTSIMFASETFINLVKQIAVYGVPFKIAFLAFLLKLPSIIVLTIPMGLLLATILTFNKLSLNSEITVMRACGISIGRMALPAIIFSIIAGFGCFIINEIIVPAADIQSKNLTIWALSQRNLAEGKKNFSFKEMNDDHSLKRLFYVSEYSDKTMKGITVLDLSKDGAIQLMQAREGKASPTSWNFKKGIEYTISKTGKMFNTATFEHSTISAGIAIPENLRMSNSGNLNVIQLSKKIEEAKQRIKKASNIEFYRNLLEELQLKYYFKFATATIGFFLVLIGIPLALTPPRARFNRGLLFSIGIIFVYYIIKALSLSLGEMDVLPPLLAAWSPNLIIGTLGAALFYKKAYLI
jgi:lipopolysaccharide export system permease protein